MEEKTYRMKHFTPGKRVIFEDREHIVDYVTLRGFDLYVHLVGHTGGIISDNVYCDPTVFSLERNNAGK